MSERKDKVEVIMATDSSEISAKDIGIDPNAFEARNNSHGGKTKSKHKKGNRDAKKTKKKKHTSTKHKKSSSSKKCNIPEVPDVAKLSSENDAGSTKASKDLNGYEKTEQGFKTKTQDSPRFKKHQTRMKQRYKYKGNENNLANESDSEDSNTSTSPGVLRIRGMGATGTGADRYARTVWMPSSNNLNRTVTTNESAIQAILVSDEEAVDPSDIAEQTRQEIFRHMVVGEVLPTTDVTEDATKLGRVSCSWRKRLTILVAVFLIVIALFLILYFSLQDPSKSELDTAVTLLSDFIPELSSSMTITERQQKALEWLVEKDAGLLDASVRVDGSETYRILLLERFTLATLAFSTNIQDWRTNLNWMSDLPVCFLFVFGMASTVKPMAKM